MQTMRQQYRGKKTCSPLSRSGVCHPARSCLAEHPRTHNMHTNRKAARNFITLHLFTRYKVLAMTCLRLVCLMVGSHELARDVSENPKLLEV